MRPGPNKDNVHPCSGIIFLMAVKRVRRFIGIIILIISSILLAWGLWPSQVTQLRLQFSEIDILGKDFISSSNDQDNILVEERLYSGDRTLLIEHTSRIKQGDQGYVTFLFENIDEINPGRDVQKSLPSENLAISGDISPVIKVRLELTGTFYSPEGELLEPLKPGIPVKFRWDLRPYDDDNVSGNLWVYLVLVSTEEGEVFRRALSAQELNIDVISLFGLPGSTTRILGVIGIALGLSLVMDIISQWVKRIS